MTKEKDLGFYVDPSTPIANEVLDTFNLVVSQKPADARPFDDALLGQIGYAIGAVAEIERRLIALEEIVRAGMGPRG